MAQFSNFGSGPRTGSGSNDKDKFTGNTQIQLEIPQNVEAEEAVLGSLLIDRDLIALVAPVLEPFHFFNRERSGIYRALLNLYVKEIPGDLVTVRNELKTMQLLGEGPEMVSSSYLLKLMQATPTPVHVLYYAKILHSFWLARKLIGEGSRMVASSYGGPNKADEILAENLERMQHLATIVIGRDNPHFTSHESSQEHFIKLAEEVNQKLQEASLNGEDKSKNDLPRLRFGWAEFDGRDWTESPILSLLPSTLTTILGRTGGGKTLIASQIADANAQAGLNVLYFHVELNREQMLARRYCRMTGVPILNQLQRKLSDRDLGLLSEATGKISNWPGRVDFVHCPEWTIEKLIGELKARHVALAVKTGRGYDLIVLDYLQRLGWPTNCNSEREALVHNVRRFSDVLNELDLAGLMTSQVARNESRQYEPPDLDEGLGTGEIERCSNQLLALAISRDKILGKYAIRKNTFAESDITGALTFDARRLQFL